MLKNVTTSLFVAALIAFASAVNADPSQPYFGPHQGTVTGSAAFSYDDASGKGKTIGIGNLNLGVQEYLTPQAWLKELLNYSWTSGNGSSNSTQYGIEVGYDFLQEQNINPYVGVGLVGVTGTGISGTTSFLGTVGVDDYFSKGRAVYLEEDYDQANGITNWITYVGLRIDFNNP